MAALSLALLGSWGLRRRHRFQELGEEAVRTKEEKNERKETLYRTSTDSPPLLLPTTAIRPY